MITLGFVGVEAFDYIVFLAMTLCNLGHKVLIVDVNHSKSLSFVIGDPVGIDSKKEMILSQGIFYIQRIPTEKELEEFQEGISIVSLGWNDPKDYSYEFHTLFIVLDPFPHVLQQFMDMSVKEDSSLETDSKERNGLGQTRCRFIFRDLIGVENRKQLGQMLRTKEDRISFISFDLKDREIAWTCQMRQQFKLRELSYDLKEWIQEVITEIFDHIKIRDIKAALKSNRKRYLHE